MSTMSQAGENALMTEEGKVNKAYPDPVWGWRTPTIGVGHTGPEVYQGLVWTDAQVLAALSSDLRSREAVLDELVTPYVSLKQNQIDAVLSWGFNVGTGAMRSSHLMAYLAKGDFAAASAEFPKWNIPSILIQRRVRERAMFDGVKTGIVRPPTVSTADVQRFLGIPADGTYGPQTATAVAHWQANHGLVADGLVGPRTQAAMFPEKLPLLERIFG